MFNGSIVEKMNDTELLLKNQNMTVRFSHIDDADMFDFYTDLIWKKKRNI